MRSEGDTTAELAFAVADAYHGRGLGTALFGALVDVAAAHGIVALTAQVMATNRRMISVFARAGAVSAGPSSGGVVDFVFDLAAHRR